MNSAGDGDPGRQDPGDEDPGYQDPDDEDPDDEELYNPISYERDPFGSEATRPDATARRTGIWPDESWPPRRPPKRRPPRWIIAATAAVVVAAAAAGTAFALAGGSPTRPAAQSPSAQSPSVPPLPPPVTVAEARAILTRYTAAANAASARLDTAALDGFETGSSRALDAASFATQRAQGSPPGPAVTPARPTFYIPRQGPGYPHWFAVSVANQTVANQTAGGGDSALNTRALDTRALDTQYLLFTQSAPGAPWLDAAEPYLLGDATAPSIALDSDGYATAVTDTGSTGTGSTGTGSTGTGTTGSGPALAVAPSRLPQATADALNGNNGASGNRMTGPPDLADAGAADWGRTQLPRGSSVTDVHTPTGGPVLDGPVLGLRTVGGGALLFYTDTATVTLTAAPGTTFRVAIAGFFDVRKPLTRASLVYGDQFAAYDPPRGSGAPRVVADHSGLERGSGSSS